MRLYYFTFGSGQKYGPAYTKILAKDEPEARIIMNERFGNQWAFCYKKFEDIHFLDRKHEVIWRGPVVISHNEVKDE
jgi:hypothetical protein